MRWMEILVRLAEAAVVEVFEEPDLRRAGGRARRVHLAAASGQRDGCDEREQGEALHDSESFRIRRSTLR